MDKKLTLNKIKEAGVVAVIRGPSPELTIKMVEALVNGGVTGIEITYSTPNAEEVVKQLDAHFGDQIILGMGTLTEPMQASAAREAGARFLVSPVCEHGLGMAMIDTGLAVMIGALTPTEVLQAYKLGSDVVKVFPGSAVGPSYIKALKGPFPIDSPHANRWSVSGECCRMVCSRCICSWCWKRTLSAAVGQRRQVRRDLQKGC